MASPSINTCIPRDWGRADAIDVPLSSSSSGGRDDPVTGRSCLIGRRYECRGGGDTQQQQQQLGATAAAFQHRGGGEVSSCATTQDSLPLHQRLKMFKKGRNSPWVGRGRQGVDREDVLSARDEER